MAPFMQVLFLVSAVAKRMLLHKAAFAALLKHVTC